MKIEEKEFVPILLGNDINTYSMARAFYEEYQIKTIVIGKYPTGPSCHSKIIDYYSNVNLDKTEVFVSVINDLANNLSSKKLLLLGCGDNYVEQIIKNRARLNGNVIVPYITEDLMNDLLTKEKFYQICDKEQLDYPQTFVYYKEMADSFEIPFAFPVILKPSNGINYWENDFKEQHKVYKLDNLEDLKRVIEQIYNAGYEDSLIIQDFIPGDDSFMRAMTSFSGQDKKVKILALGHVLLEEHTPHGLGNAAVIMNEYNQELADKIKGFLENIGFVGFSSIDLKYDQRDGKIKILEVNLRQGRGNYYVTGAGHNLAKYIVDEYIYNKDNSYTVVNREHLWTVIPMWVAFRVIRGMDQLNQMRELVKENRVVNPLFMKGDNKIRRLLFLYKSHLSHFIKFRKYYNPS